MDFSNFIARFFQYSPNDWRSSFELAFEIGRCVITIAIHVDNLVDQRSNEQPDEQIDEQKNGDIDGVGRELEKWGQFDRC
jgi:hypothetical protein